MNIRQFKTRMGIDYEIPCVIILYKHLSHILPVMSATRFQRINKTGPICSISIALTKTYIELHGGQIELNNTEEEEPDPESPTTPARPKAKKEAPFLTLLSYSSVTVQFLSIPVRNPTAQTGKPEPTVLELAPDKEPATNEAHDTTVPTKTQ